MYEPPSSPQPIGGVLDDGFKLYRASLSRVLPLAFLATLAGQLPSLMLPVGTLPNLGIAYLATLLVSMIMSMVFFGAVIGRMHAAAANRVMSLQDALGLAVRRLVPLAAAALLYTLILIAGLVLLLVPGIILGLSLMFSVYVVLLEGEGPLAGLKTSHQLVWGNWWRTFVIVSVAMLVLMAAYMLVGFAVGFAVAFGGGTEPGGGLMRFLELVLLPVFGAVLTPLIYALILATYYDLKLRRSGADLEQRLAATAHA